MLELVTQLHIENILTFIIESIVSFLFGSLLTFLFFIAMVKICENYRKAKRHKWLMIIAFCVEWFFAFFGFTFDDITEWKKKRQKYLYLAKLKLKKSTKTTEI